MNDNHAANASRTKSRVATVIVSIPAFASLAFIIYMSVSPFLRPPDPDRVVRSRYDLGALVSWAGECVRSEALLRIAAATPVATPVDIPRSMWSPLLTTEATRAVTLRRDQDPPVVFVTLAVDELPDMTLCLDPALRKRLVRTWRQIADGVWRVSARSL